MLNKTGCFEPTDIWADQENMSIYLFCLFVLLLYIPGNAYGHGGTVNLPNKKLFTGPA